MTIEQFEALKAGIDSGLIDKKGAELIILKHEAKDIEKATASAKSHARQIRTDLGLPHLNPVPTRLGEQLTSPFKPQLTQMY